MPGATCHIITDLDIGGAEMMLKSLLEAQIGNRQNIVVISLTGLGKIGCQLQKLGIRVYTLNMQGKFAFPVAFFQLLRLLKVIRPSVVQTWMYHADLLGGLAASFAGIKSIVWGIHCTKVPIGRPLTYVVMKCSAWLSYLIPHKILCVAEAARYNHVQYGYCADKMQVIPNGFKTDTPVKTTRHLPLLLKAGLENPDACIVGCVGRWHPDKGQDLLIAAAAICLKQTEMTFAFVGRGCDESNHELIKLLEQSGVRHAVMLLGERDDIPQLLPEFDIFCLPSRSEAFPVALGEAMLAGLPCIATDVGDCAELGGKHVMIVPPGDVHQLADAILLCKAKSAEQLQLSGFLGRQHIIERFSINAVSSRYEDVYRELSGF